MIIKQAEYIISGTEIKHLPEPGLPEYAFIGRSNVGKSSLINMLTNRKGLAKISGTPGKTQTINYFLINEDWYLVDLPGYGYAKVAKTSRQKWSSSTEKFLKKRKTLTLVFVLIDSRIPPQKIDIDFINWLGENGLPFSIVFTKADKVKPLQLKNSVEKFRNTLLKHWEELPDDFISSAVNRKGQAEILHFIGETNQLIKSN